jgi:peroxiredoxin Q/BCP
MVEEGQIVPDFELPANGDQTISLQSLRGKNVVIYFYPKDNTKGCTTEGNDFKDNYAAFQEANTEILGVSRDSVRSHNNFVKKYDFPFSLLSDADEEVCKIFDVIKEKSMYGKTYLGIERSTFLIDTEGRLVKAWRKVKVKGHVAEVLSVAQEQST